MEFILPALAGWIIIGLASRIADLERRIERLESDRE